jgi:glycosyltransferase involved in cell wall biosynthesis
VSAGSPTPGAPRVTLGIATYNRDTYLGEAVASCLAQDYASLEVLVVIDGSTNPAVEQVLAGFAGDPRLRIVRPPVQSRDRRRLQHVRDRGPGAS